MDLKTKEGTLDGPKTQTLSADLVQVFCKATGATERGGVIPPTFLTRYRDTEFKILADIGVQLSEVLHAEQEYEYIADLKIGDKIEYTSKLASVLEKKGKESNLTFLNFETEILNLSTNRQKAAITRTKIVVRKKVTS